MPAYATMDFSVTPAPPMFLNRCSQSKVHNQPPGKLRKSNFSTTRVSQLKPASSRACLLCVRLWHRLPLEVICDDEAVPIREGAGGGFYKFPFGHIRSTKCVVTGGALLPQSVQCRTARATMQQRKTARKQASQATRQRQ